MQKFKPAVKKYLSERLYDWRKELSLTQEEVAESFHITPRAYGDLERGKYCFSTVVLLLFLCLLEDDVLLSVVRGLRKDVFKLIGSERVSSRQ